MTEIFKFKEQQVRVIGSADDYWWIAKDVCAVLNISNNRNCLNGLAQDELIETYSSFDLLAIAIECSFNGDIKKAEKILQFVGASMRNGFISPSLERIYFACRIFQAWSKAQEKRIEGEKAEVVYLVGCKENQSMKIGTTSEISKRLIALQVSSPFQLEVLATVKGGQELERLLHQEFQSCRLRSEWFSWSEEILAKFQQINEVQK